MRKTLGINVSHHVSFAYFEDDVLKEFYEEDRFNKDKHFAPPNLFFHGPYEYLVLKKFKNIIFDTVLFSSADKGDISIEKAIIDPILSQIKFKDMKFYLREHHLFHALSGFYFSNFDEALCLICDGGGERYNFDYSYDAQSRFRVYESIYKINNHEIIEFYKHYSNARDDFFQGYNIFTKELNSKKQNTDIKLSNKLCGGLKYMIYMDKAGFKPHQEGQMMGIAAYKDKNTNLDKDVLKIAHEAQEVTLQERIKLIEKAMTYSNCKNIILSGGYHLNCANNFKLVKHFPKLNFFVDPIAHDAGTSIGNAYAHIKYKKNEKNFKN